MEKEMTLSDLPKRRLRTKDAAAYMGLSKSTIEKMRVTGCGPVFIKMAKTVVYDVTDLDIWMAERRFRSTAEADAALQAAA